MPFSFQPTEIQMSDFPLITSILKGEHRPLEPLAFEVMTESGMRTLRFTPDAARQFAAHISAELPDKQASE